MHSIHLYPYPSYVLQGPVILELSYGTCQIWHRPRRGSCACPVAFQCFLPQEKSTCLVHGAGMFFKCFLPCSSLNLKASQLCCSSVGCGLRRLKLCNPLCFISCQWLHSFSPHAPSWKQSEQVTPLCPGRAVAPASCKSVRSNENVTCFDKTHRAPPHSFKVLQQN